LPLDEQPNYEEKDVSVRFKHGFVSFFTCYMYVFMFSEWASAIGINGDIGQKTKAELAANLRLF